MVFNIGMMELLLVLVIAFLVVGPKDLPKVARWLARQLKSLRKLVNSVKDELGWDELTRDVSEAKKQVEDTFRDADVSSEMREAAQELRTATQGLQEEVRKAAKDMEKAVEME